jgi:hypothetical protein
MVGMYVLDNGVISGRYWTRCSAKAKVRPRSGGKRWDEWKFVSREERKGVEEQRRQGLIGSGGNAVLATHWGTVLAPCRR